MGLFDWFRRESKEAQPDEELKPGICECGHTRCSHIDGKGRCKASWPPDEDDDERLGCACQLYIRDDDDDDEEEMPEPTSPELTELERLSKL